MFARLLRIKTNIDQIDDVAKIFEESVIPLCKKQKGFVTAYFLADRQEGNCIPITVWESEEDMLETERNRFFQEQLVKLMDFFLLPPVREAYEVVVQG